MSRWVDVPPSKFSYRPRKATRGIHEVGRRLREQRSTAEVEILERTVQELQVQVAELTPPPVGNA
ncbi:MAG: hypothetical protein QM784_08710 [Polyangiaceae bacterium]